MISCKRWLAGLCLGLWLVQLPARGEDSPWERVVMIGASASAGFVLSEPFGGTNTAKCKLSHYLNPAITAPHSLTNLSSALVFMSPEAFEPVQVNNALKAKPTLVIALDFMFWYCYGDGPEAERTQKFEKGLKLLEQFPCPLVVGDIPDASSATNTGIIGPEQVPTEATRRAVNQRLREWAAMHTNVTIMPLAEFMHAVIANDTIKLRDETLPAGKTRTLVQKDLLHPTPRGATVLALATLNALVSKQPAFAVGDVCWDRTTVFQKGYAAAQVVR